MVYLSNATVDFKSEIMDDDKVLAWRSVEVNLECSLFFGCHTDGQIPQFLFKQLPLFDRYALFGEQILKDRDLRFFVIRTFDEHDWLS